MENSAPEPPSSQSASLAKRQVSVHSPPVIGCGGGGVGDGGATAPGGGGEGDGGGGDAPGGRRPRRPQSMQSSPRVHRAYSAPGPPSSQSLSEAYLQLLLHIPGGLGGGPGGGGFGRGEGGLGGGLGGGGGIGGEGGGLGGSGAQPAPTVAPAKRNMFGESVCTSEMTLGVAWQRSASMT